MAATVDELAATIQARVMSGEFAYGAHLRQEALASEFGVSRTPVREALRKLQASGVVELRPNRGARVRGPSAREIGEAYQVRAELEGLAAQLAATRIGEAELRRLREAERLFRSAVSNLLKRRRERRSVRPSAREIRAWGRGNDMFHLTIQEAGGNDRLRATLADLHRSFPRDLSRLVLMESSRLLEENVEQHRQILAAIERRDAPAARRLMVDHVRRAGELVSLRFEQRERAAAAS